jgi:hypothetical protein
MILRLLLCSKTTSFFFWVKYYVPLHILWYLFFRILLYTYNKLFSLAAHAPFKINQMSSTLSRKETLVLWRLTEHIIKTTVIMSYLIFFTSESYNLINYFSFVIHTPLKTNPISSTFITYQIIQWFKPFSKRTKAYTQLDGTPDSCNLQML